MNQQVRLNYQGYPIIQVRVISVHPNRLIVSLPDRRRGVIYKRDWSWDRSIRRKSSNFREGEKINAVLIEQKVNAEHPRLSIRHMQDQWESTKQYALNQTMLGEVIYIRSIAAYIQLQPGITGVAWAKDLPLLPHQLPSDILVLGDQVFATITQFNHKSRQLELSLLAPLRQEESLTQYQIKDLKSFFTPRLEELQRKVKEGTQASKLNEKQFLLTNPLLQISNILLIENNPHDGIFLKNLLTGEFNTSVSWVDTGAKAADFLSLNAGITDLIITDLNLDHGESGLDIGQKIIQKYPDLPLIFISNNILAKPDIFRLEEIYKRPLLFIEKPYDSKTSLEFTQAIRYLQKGKIVKPGGIAPARDERFLNHLEQQLASNLPLSEKLEQILEDLSLASGINHALMISFNSEEKTFKLLAAYPISQRISYSENMDNLYYSPVRDIAEDGEIFYIGQLGDEKKLITIRNFFPGLSFSSCYGMPVMIPVSPLKFALLILDKRPDISGNTIMRIRSAAAFITLAIEREQMLSILRLQQDRAMQGILMGTLLHELNNKLEPWYGFFEDGRVVLEENKKEAFWKYFVEAGPDILRIKDLIRAYTRLANADLQDVDLKKIVTKVDQQLTPHAQQSGIKINVHIEDSLPLIAAIPIHIEQVLTNIVLNALQLIEEQDWQWRQINQQLTHTPEKMLRSQKIVSIDTCVSPYLDACCILVSDSGPGVPYALRDRIFQANVSTRKGGQGLGLYISRNLVEAMGGRLEWVDSIRFAGTIFTIIFPITKPSNNGESN